METNPRFCDRAALALHRDRALRRPEQFLHEEAAFEIEERLNEVNRTFTAPVLIGHALPPLRALLPKAPLVADRDRLDLEAGAHDLALHLFSLHWADDPVGQMVQARLALKPDGMFLGVMFGGATLNELRTALAEAESRLTGGLSPRVAPMADLRDLGALIQRAGLNLPVADSRRLTVRYKALSHLVRDLRGMGETNALAQRERQPMPRALFDHTEEIYRTHFSDDEGYLTATFELVFLAGWSPSDTQQKPLRPGSAKARLADALGVDEIQTGDRVAPPER